MRIPNRGFTCNVNVLRSFLQLRSASAVPHIQRSSLFSTISTSSLSLPRFYSTVVSGYDATCLSMQCFSPVAAEQYYAMVDVQLRNEDLRIDTFRSGGSGGQHANTANNAVRVTRLPIGVTVARQEERSQHM